MAWGKMETFLRISRTNTAESDDNINVRLNLSLLQRSQIAYPKMFAYAVCGIAEFMWTVLFLSRGRFRRTPLKLA